MDISIETLVPGNAEQKAAFEALNREWLEKHFRVEPVDDAVLNDPEGHILAHGGVILMARLGSMYVGTVTLLAHADGTFELAKMGVSPSVQGKGIGRRLADALLALAKGRGITKLYVVSNTKLVPAIALYRSLGFFDSAENKHSRYERGNITLEKALLQKELA